MGELFDPWLCEDSWRAVATCFAWLVTTEGSDVAQAFVINALAAELAGPLVLASRAAAISDAGERREAWQAVAAIVAVTRRAMRNADRIAELRPALERANALLDSLGRLAALTPPARPQAAAKPTELRPQPARARSLASWLMSTGPEAALAITANAATTLPGIERECSAWAREIGCAWTALGSA